MRAALAGGGVHASGVEIVAADTSAESGWDAAIAGVDFVRLVASPISPEGVKRAGDYVRPAVDGAIRVLRAAVKSGVKRARNAAHARRRDEIARWGID